MGFVHPEHADIFVSYAWENDKPGPGLKTGWVSFFFDFLVLGLAQKLGSTRDFSIFIDRKMPSNTRLTPELEAQVRTSALLLPILSPSYLGSDWCKLELATFLDEEARRATGSRSRIFAVEYERVEPPAGVKDLLRKRFWTEDPVSQETRVLGFPELLPADKERYYDILNDLCNDIASELKLQKQERGKSTTSVPVSAPANVGASPPAIKAAPVSGPTVYLAETTDDLEIPHDEVKRYLVQAGFRILPERNLPGELASFQEKVRQDLQESILFVQLLSAVLGRKFEGSEQRLPAVQCACAAGLGKPILQWRSPKVDLTAVPIGAHRTLLDGPEVMKVGLEEFKAAIVTRVRKLLMPPPPAVAKGDANCFIFVNASEDDMALARSIKAELDRRKVGNALPLRSGKVSSDREDLEQNLRECDGLLVIFGQTEPHWVRSQLLQSRKILYQRERPLRAIGIYEGPPQKSEDSLGGFSLPNLEVLRCDAGPSTDAIGQFVDTVLARGI